MRFEIEDEFDKYKISCVLRLIICFNEGCGDVFFVLYVDVYDVLCVYKFFLCFFECEFLV